MDYEAATRELQDLKAVTVNAPATDRRIAAIHAQAAVDQAASLRAIVGLMMSAHGDDAPDIEPDEDTPDDGYTEPGDPEVGDWVDLREGEGVGFAGPQRVVATGIDQGELWLELASLPGVKTWASEWVIVDEPEGLDDGIGADPEPNTVTVTNGLGETILEYPDRIIDTDGDEIEDDFGAKPEESSETQAAALQKLRKAKGKGKKS